MVEEFAFRVNAAGQAFDVYRALSMQPRDGYLHRFRAGKLSLVECSGRPLGQARARKLSQVIRKKAHYYWLAAVRIPVSEPARSGKIIGRPA
jgi:hypothetical protein